MTVEIVLLRTDNVGLLNNIAADVFDYEIKPKYLQAFLHDPRHIMYLAVINQRVVGMASAVEYFHPDKPPQLWINEVGVAPSYRNQGIGRRLIQALVESAEHRECICAWLGTDTDNAAAQACFRAVPGAQLPQSFLLYEWELEDFS